jgi:WD40 repeat protein
LEQDFVDRLKKLIAEQGKEALLDPKIFNKYISDYRGSEYKKESQKLAEALEAGIARAIDGADDLAACKKAKIRDLEQELSPAWAADIVNTLALVLRGDTTSADPMYSKWRLVRTFEHEADVNVVAFSLNGRHIISGSYKTMMKLWETASGRLVRTFEGNERAGYLIAFSPDGQYIVSGRFYDKAFKLWETTSGQRVRTFEGNERALVHVAAFSSDSRHIVSGSCKTLKLWETASGRLVRTFEGNERDVVLVAFSPDGQYIVSGGSYDTAFKLWEAASGQLVRTFEHGARVYVVAFSSDSRHIVSGSDKTMKLWETTSGCLVRTFEGHEKQVNSVAFSPDGQYIVSGSQDKTMKLWETASGSLVRTFEGHDTSVRSAVFSPDGQYIVSGSGDHTLKLWGLE